VFSDGSSVESPGIEGSAWFRAQLIVDMIGGDQSLLCGLMKKKLSTDETILDVLKIY
jgi:hypothetical protein